ncbi:hypothetical protein CIP107527_00088 [Corynebacterium diphtheriae]|nr:hypothetical protein CIP107527_00088 [Corynebacterium diphtheriae]CAB0626929.1 hypothetical protein CIP107567_00118 [Corynebacterium diphtheriae]
MRTPHRQGHTRWTKLPLVFAVGTLSAAMLAACGSDTATDTTDGSAGPSSPAAASATPTTADALSGRIVGAEDAPRRPHTRGLLRHVRLHRRNPQRHHQPTRM